MALGYGGDQRGPPCDRLELVVVSWWNTVNILLDLVLRVVGL